MKLPWKDTSLWPVVLWLMIVGLQWTGGQSEFVEKCPRADEIAPCRCRTRGPTIQVRCSNSMMKRITEAMINIRKRVDVVDVLILEDNNIQHLPSRAFGSVPVNRLFLDNNRMHSIDRNAFAGIEEFIGEIYIKEPKLKILPKDSIDFLSNLTVFSVEKSAITDVPNLSGLQNLQLFKIQGSQVRTLHSEGLRNLPSLRYLHISESQLSRLDIGILENMHGLSLANFQDNQIKWIHPRSFRFMEGLTEVNLSGNKIKDAAMVGRAMRAIKMLKKLDMSRNEISDIQPGSLTDVISLEDINLSRNQITALNRGAFHHMPKLVSVDLSFNQIRSFHSDSFIDTPLIERLYLGHNELNFLTDVSFVIDSLPRLSLLHLSHNDIREIPFGVLHGYPSLETLNLAHNQISHLSRGALSDLPSLRSLDLSSNKLLADVLDGSTFDLPNLNHLNLSMNKLSILQEGLFQNLNQLHTLDISHNGIISIEVDALQPVQHLRNFNASFNNIRELDGHTFQGLKELSILDFSHNELVALPDGLLGDQLQMEELYFSKNQIQLVSSRLIAPNSSLQLIDFSSNYLLKFPQDLIGNAPSLKKLFFSRNAIQHLGHRTFLGVQELEDIDLHDNRIESIADDSFEGLSRLKTLDLGLNIISTVGDSLEPLTNLMRLNLSDNYITSLPRKAFHSLTRLSTLDLSNNTIMEIGAAFVGMPELKYLDLSYNHLPKIKMGSFKNLPSLISLKLHDNSLTEVESDAFEDLQSLEVIDLSRNGLERVKEDTFKDLPNMEELFLNDNLIRSLNDRCFVDLFSLRDLHLDQNLMVEFNNYAFVRIPSIRFLNTSYNLITYLPPTAFRGLETLEKLDISFNDLRELDEMIFREMKWLTDLELNDNNICSILGKSFADAESLRNVDLRNNRLTSIAENSFGDNHYHIARMTVAGNPFTCDCNTLWLRNLASDTSVIADEPICYFPASLSGNPLRQLRTSRFRCEDNPRPGLLAQDSCERIPLKKPVRNAAQAQVLQAQVLESEPVAEVSTHYPMVTTEFLEEPDASATSVNEDVVGVDLNEKSDVDLYEYYYVYYDEDGNVVDQNDTKKTKSPPQPPVPLPVGETKVQDIPLNAANAPNDDKVTGDTPTIYAEIKDPDQEENDSNDNGGGLSIFGIPIPRLPLNLNFAFAPVLSQGLLPIGRKGDNPESLRDPASQSLPSKDTDGGAEGDQTRGPDTLLNPVWIETGLKAAGILLPKLAESFANRGKYTNSAKTTEKRSHPPSEAGKVDLFNYQHPTNPIIPLNSGDSQNDPSTSDYFPANYIPAVEFSHPVPLNSPITLSGHHPVLPPPKWSSNPSEHQSHRPQTNAGYPPSGSLSFGSSQSHVNGFKPLFRPHSEVSWPSGSGRGEEDLASVFPSPNPSQDPGVQDTIGEFDYNDSGVPSRRTERVPFELGPTFDAVPPQDLTGEPNNNPPLRNDWPEGSDLPHEFEAVQDFEEDIASSTMVSSLPGFNPPQGHVEGQAEIRRLLEEFRRKELEGSEVPTLELPTESSTLRTNSELGDGVEIAHRGTPKDMLPLGEEDYPTFFPDYPTTLSTTDVEDLVANDTEAEYEYYYEYYDNERPVPTTETGVSTSTISTGANGDGIKAEPQQSLDDIFNMIQFEDKPDSTTTFFTTQTEEPIQTQTPIIRTSTQLYDINGNYLNSMRSSVIANSPSSVQLEPEVVIPRSSSSKPETHLPQRSPTTEFASPPPEATSFPFQPDRIDPARPHPLDSPSRNKVGWYYSNYNNEEEVKPFQGRGIDFSPSAHQNQASASGSGTIGCTILIVGVAWLSTQVLLNS